MSTGETVTLSHAGLAGAPVAGTVPRQIGPVRLVREIGRGGMGVVWLGRHEVLARDVAVKFLLQAVSGSAGTGYQDLLAEARAAASVRHAGLVVVHDAAVVSAVPYLVMDYVDGVALSDLLRETGPLRAAPALAALDVVGNAVAALHVAGLVHRDLKPRNVLLDRAGRPYVGDFGLACACAPAQRAQFQAAGGTPPYMAPEMFEGQASPRSDVYAMGVMLYELLTGVRPFGGETLEEIHARHRDQALPLEPLEQHGVVPAVIEVLERATHKNGLYRYKTARHLVQALHTAVPNEEVWSRGAGELAQLAGRCDHQAIRRLPSGPSPPPTPTTYEELLASKAAGKRAGKGHSPDTSATTPVAAETSAAPTPEVRPSQSPSASAGHGAAVLCVKCGYNLHGLSAGGHCPECGTPVAHSSRGDHLAAADPVWLERISRGQAYIAVGSVLAPLLPMATTAVLIHAGVATRLRHALAWSSCAGALILMLMGVVRLTALDPRLSLTRQPLGLRRLSRGAALAALLGLALRLGAAVLPAGMPRAVADVLGGTSLVFLVFTVFVVTLYLARLAERVPEPQLAQRTRRAARGFMVCFLGPVAVGLGIWRHPRLVWPHSTLELGLWLDLVLGAALSLGFLLYLADIRKFWWAYRKIFKRCLLASRRFAAG
jgi:serine/threonine protein kinase